MVLREFEIRDSIIICGWPESRMDVFMWSAEKFGIFTLDENALADFYEAGWGDNILIPLVGVNDAGDVEGHILLRYVDPSNRDEVRFSFVIVAPSIRGVGKGSELIGLAIEYVRDTLKASKIHLGVFEQNVPAVRCYESMGFVTTGSEVVYKTPDGDVWNCVEMEMLL